MITWAVSYIFRAGTWRVRLYYMCWYHYPSLLLSYLCTAPWNHQRPSYMTLRPDCTVYSWQIAADCDTATVCQHCPTVTSAVLQKYRVGLHHQLPVWVWMSGCHAMVVPVATVGSANGSLTHYGRIKPIEPLHKSSTIAWQWAVDTCDHRPLLC